jgi:hypothetical protein
MRAESISSHCSTRDTIYAARPSRLKLSRASSLAGTITCILLFCLGSIVPGYGQGSDQNLTGRPIELEKLPGYGGGKTLDDYAVQQTVEFGGRITEVTGDGAMFNTLLNEHSGPRLFEQSIFMQATPGSKDTLFDTLYGESFGWGGDPSNAARLRISKRAIYDFNASFRRDKNYFDYDLLANPLNTTTPVVNFSPHSMFLTRRMYNFDLVVFPQRMLSFRLGFDRNVNEGPSFSSDHQGTEALLLQQYSTTEDDYRMGASYRLLPRTTLSYDETLRSLKNDTDQALSPVDTILSSGAGLNTFTSYTRTQRYRTFLPVEQVRLTSSSIRNVEFNARFMYSNADAETPLSEDFTGLITRTGQTNFNTNGSAAHSNWVSEEADGGVTIHFTPQFRLVDSFRYYAYRIPGILNLLGNGPVGIQCTGAYNVECIRFSQQSVKSNDFALEYDVTRHFGVRAGYIYRNIFDGHFWFTCPGLVGTPDAIANCRNNPLLQTDAEVGTTTLIDGNPINQHTAVGGVWYRFSDKVRADAEVRLMSGDNYLTRIDPRREQQYRANLTFMPEPWLTATAGVNLREQRDAALDSAPGTVPTDSINYKAHVRNFAFSLVATPSSRLSIDVAYDYTSTGQDNNICYAYGTATPVPGSVGCTNEIVAAAPAAPANPFEILAFYSNHTHYGSANVVFKPVNRVSVGVGYSVIDVDGDTLILNANQPLGSLGYRYDQPLGFVHVDVTKQIQLRAGWNYYQYNENTAGNSLSATVPAYLASPTRYFHANLTTLSMRYSF